MKTVANVRKLATKRLSESQKIRLRQLKHGERRWQRTLTEAVTRTFTYNLAQRNVESQTDAVTVDQEFDARAHMAQTRTVVRDLLRAARLDFVELPRLSVFRPILVVKQDDVPAVVDAITALQADAGWQVRAFGESRRPLRLKDLRKDPQSMVRLTIRQRVVAANGREMSTYREMLTIEPWEDLSFGIDRVDGETHIEGTLHRRLQTPRTFVEYIPPHIWRSTIDDQDSVLQLDAPHLYAVREPIDIVYTWVDGEDPAWAQRKQEALAHIDPTAINETAASESRFESRNELKYSLRSVEYYASWVNRIFIVTDGQVPSWLNVDHPKITVVDHTEIFKDTSVLPVFNSHAIESQLHHIPELSERYLYMNDDLMFMRPTDPELFFTANGMSKFFPSTAPLDVTERSVRDMPVLSAAKRGRSFMVERFGRTVTNKFKHTPHPQQKSVLEQMERENQEMFDAVAASSFRHPDDYSIPAALQHFYAFAQGRAVIGSIRYAYMDIARPDARTYLDRLSRRRNLDVLCVNDTNLPDEKREELGELLRDFFSMRFPVPSSFETQ